jgi:hypothetical protein
LSSIFVIAVTSSRKNNWNELSDFFIDPLDKGGGLVPPDGSGQDGHGSDSTSSSHNAVLNNDNLGFSNAVPIDGDNGPGKYCELSTPGVKTT